MAEPTEPPESLIPHFRLTKILNQDQAGRRTVLHGSIHTKPALLILERAPFPTSPSDFETLPSSLLNLKNLGANDIYFWYLANNSTAETSTSKKIPADLKINLIYPCTETHIRKYSKQKVRSVLETSEIYKEKVRPFIERKRGEGRLTWVENIIEGKTEVEDVIFRTPYNPDIPNSNGFLLLPDMNWDRETLSSLHLLALVERRDIWSLRDLKKNHISWLGELRRSIVEATVEVYGERGLEGDELKFYVHYQPTYYHFHVHVVHVACEAGVTQATGKAWALEGLVSMLQVMGDGERGLDGEGVDLAYTVGEESELWKEVWGPLKRGKGEGL